MMAARRGTLGSVCTAWYGVLLRLYPEDVRRAYGRDMTDCFRDLVTQAMRDRGIWGGLAVVWRTTIEAPGSALDARRGRDRRAGPRGGPRRAPGGLVDPLLQDVRYAVRGLRKHLGFTMLAIASLALGVGANTTMISTVRSVLWRGLPVPGAESLVRLFESRDGLSNFSYANFRDIRDQTSEVFSGMFVHNLQDLGLGTDQGSVVIHGEIVSPSYFDVLGVPPHIGRLFSEEGHAGPTGDPLVVLSHALWSDRFGADPRIVGSTVRLNGDGYTVVAVAPEGFHGTKFGLALDAWIPIDIWGSLRGWGEWTERRNSRWLEVVARLREGQTLEDARAAVGVVAARLVATQPEFESDRSFAVYPERVIAPEAASLPDLVGTLAIGASALVLLVACANVVSLLFARGVARRKEIAVRVALGGRRSRIVRQLLTESVLLALLGGGAGAALAFWSTDFILMFLPEVPYRFSIDARPDLAVLAITLGVSVACAFVFGTAPALQSTKPDLVAAIKGEVEGNRGEHRTRMLNAVVVAMVSLSFVTLLLTALFTRSLDNVRSLEPGFAVDNRLYVAVDPRLGGLDTPAAHRFIQRFADEARRLPGVRSVGAGQILPLGDRSNSSRVYATDRTYGPDDDGVTAWSNVVSDEYFTAIGTNVRTGRTFREADAGGPRVVVVNETLASRLWPDGDVIGRRLRYQRTSVPDSMTLEVVGVVEDGRYLNIAETPRAAIYRPQRQVPFNYAELVVHGSGDPRALFPAVREVARQIDPNVPLFNVRTGARHLEGALFLFRMGASVGTALGLLALLLAAAGLYGVMAFAVRQRSKELGIRAALGARRERLLGLVVWRGLRLASLGVALGAGVAVLASGALRSVLFGVEPTNPLAFASVAVGLLAIAIVACLAPATRAASANSVAVLRAD